MKSRLKKIAEIQMGDVVAPKDMGLSGNAVNVGNRDQAFLYVDGEIHFGTEHHEIINEWLSEHDNATPDSLAFGHIVSTASGKAAVIDTDTIKGDENQVISDCTLKLQNQMGQIMVFTPDDIDYETFDYLYKRVAKRLKRKIHSH